MSQANDDYDFWVSGVLADPSTFEESKLVVEPIEGVVPLDEQFGVHPAKDVPDALFDPLFGQPEPSDDEIEEAGGNSADVPPMQTYAILDAAKLVNLSAVLEASGLRYRCLFIGDAYEELKNVAPYIVRLEEGNDFTRHLFTDGKAPWYMWDKEPGIYVRSRKTLDQLWRHFRKFTRVQDKGGKWYYWRFWEHGVIQYYLESSVLNSQKYMFNDLVHGFIVRGIFDGFLEIRLPSFSNSETAEKMRLTNANFKAFQKMKRVRFCRDTIHWLKEAYPDIEVTQSRKQLLLDEIEFLNACDPNCDQRSAAHYLAACWLSERRPLSPEHFTAPGKVNEKRQYLETLHTEAHKDYSAQMR